MSMILQIRIFLLCIVFSSVGTAQDTLLYKQIDTTRLFLEIYTSPTTETASASPAMVFFFGGGWNTGNRGHFRNHAKYFSQRGLTCFLVDYRTKERHNTTPFESLKDAKSAIRFIREKASDFGIDPNQLIASGGSAGGHLAAATALIEPFNESTDHPDTSCIPNALVLFNPVLDNGPGGYGYERIGKEYKNFSPLHNITVGAPPTILLLGTEDELIPVETVEYYKAVMEKIGSRCDLFLYEGEVHGFFNYPNFDSYKDTLLKADYFLQSLGYLEEEPLIKIK